MVMGSFLSKLIALAVAAAAAVVAALAFAPVSGGSEAVSSRDRSVSVRDDFFRPGSVTVSRGGKVTWRWRGDNLHNVRFRKVPGGASKRGSDTQASGRFARTFRKRGTYRYVCTIHEDLGMKGTVNVG
jgi:plastocyanin